MAKSGSFLGGVGDTLSKFFSEKKTDVIAAETKKEPPKVDEEARKKLLFKMLCLATSIELRKKNVLKAYWPIQFKEERTEIAKQLKQYDADFYKTHFYGFEQITFSVSQIVTGAQKLTSQYSAHEITQLVNSTLHGTYKNSGQDIQISVDHFREHVRMLAENSELERELAAERAMERALSAKGYSHYYRRP